MKGILTDKIKLFDLSAQPPAEASAGPGEVELEELSVPRKFQAPWLVIRGTQIGQSKESWKHDEQAGIWKPAPAS